MTVAVTEMASLVSFCHRIELVTEQIYRLLAIAHETSDLMRPIWLKTADEELAHARQFELLAKMNRPGQDTLVPAVTVEQARLGLQRAEQVLAEYRARPPGIEQALQRMVSLEREFADFHSHRVVDFEDRSLQYLFSALMSADQLHVETLERALAAWTKPGL